MQYKGYHAKVEYEADDRAFHGYVIGMSDIVHFTATTVEDLERELRVSVDDYLDFCKSRGEKPDKPYSGRLVFRTSPDLHRKLAIAAEMCGKSLNQFLEEAAMQAALRQS